MDFPRLINWQLLGNPANWLIVVFTVGFMALAFSMFEKPLGME